MTPRSSIGQGVGRRLSGLHAQHHGRHPERADAGAASTFSAFCLLPRPHAAVHVPVRGAPTSAPRVLHTMDNIQNGGAGLHVGPAHGYRASCRSLNAIGLLLLGVKFAIFFAIFASVLAVIPYIGIMVGRRHSGAHHAWSETGSPGQGRWPWSGVFVVVQFSG
ncbi:MAG: hypothetical protein WKG07_48600 [Hymenobacter sp.]